MKTKLSVYDNEGKTFDRYTIVLDNDRRKLGGKWLYHCIGASQNGYDCFEQGEAVKGKHLGKKISVDELPDNVKALLNDFLNINEQL